MCAMLRLGFRVLVRKEVRYVSVQVRGLFGLFRLREWPEWRKRKGPLQLRWTYDSDGHTINIYYARYKCMHHTLEYDC